MKTTETVDIKSLIREEIVNQLLEAKVTDPKAARQAYLANLLKQAGDRRASDASTTARELAHAQDPKRHPFVPFRGDAEFEPLHPEDKPDPGTDQGRKAQADAIWQQTIEDDVSNLEKLVDNIFDIVVYKIGARFKRMEKQFAAAQKDLDATQQLVLKMKPASPGQASPPPTARALPKGLGPSPIEISEIKIRIKK